LKVLLLFLDGVGIGSDDPAVNPFFAANLQVLRSLFKGKLPHKKLKSISTSHAELVPVNATLGVPGLPQSGTGQTTIFTGVNGAKFIGRHFGPFPPTALRPVIGQQNIFRRLRETGRRVVFANAFPRQFFEYTESGTRRLTVTTLSCLMSNIPLLRIDELRKNKAVSADLTRSRWPEMGYPELEVVTPETAGGHLWEIMREHDFTLFEYWLTDHAGHSCDMKKSVEVLEAFDSFLAGILERFNDASSLIVLISDHGNIEDLSTKSHTRNPVPLIVLGKKRRAFAKGVKNLTQITPRILRFMQE
jgi:hypothetical protein